MTPGRPAKLLLTVLFVGLLATPIVIKRIAARRETGKSKLNVTAALSRYGLYFQEVAKASGIDFVHQAPTLDQKLNHIMPQVAAMGAGASIVDFDRDGWQDIYLTNSGEGSKNSLYRNLGNGTFRDVAGELGIADLNQTGTGVSMGAVWGDYDNDGYEDLFLYKWGRPELFHNDGGKHFTRVSEQAGLPPWVNANTAVWLDYDGDGRVDLFVGGYYSEDINLWNLTTTRIMPESFEYANNGGRKYLFHNRHDGTFEETSVSLGIASRRWTLAVGAADLLGTGYPDLFLANDYGVSQIYANQGGKRFVDVSTETNVGRTPKSGMNAAFGDIFNDGRLSIYKTNISEPGVLVQANDLWVPKKNTAAGSPAYDDVATSVGVD